MQCDWDDNKNAFNQRKHGVSFLDAQRAFIDPHRVIAEDTKHSSPAEIRYYCFGMVDGGLMTVRFTIRGEIIRIIGAGYWRKGRKYYEKT